MKTVKGLSRRDFEKRFGDNDKCVEFLVSQKWGNGFICRKCYHSLCRKGKKSTFKRCLKCGTEESPTAHTLFHKVKFDLYKAFGMIYDIMTSKKGANTIWLSERYEVSQNTAWLFKRKVQNYLKSSKTNPLKGLVHVDEFEIGTPQKGEQGRSQSEKKSRVVIAVEIVDQGKVGNAYAQVITDFSTKSLKKIFDDHIDLQAEIVTDGWKSYTPLKRIYKKLTQGDDTYVVMITPGGKEITVPLTQREAIQLPITDPNEPSPQYVDLAETIVLGNGSTNPTNDPAKSYFARSNMPYINNLNVKADVTASQTNSGKKFLTLRLNIPGIGWSPLKLDKFPMPSDGIINFVNSLTDDDVKQLYLSDPRVPAEWKTAIQSIK